MSPSGIGQAGRSSAKGSGALSRREDGRLVAASGVGVSLSHPSRKDKNAVPRGRPGGAPAWMPAGSMAFHACRPGSINSFMFFSHSSAGGGNSMPLVREENVLYSHTEMLQSKAIAAGCVLPGFGGRNDANCHR
jgi:hypothetical protein